MKNTVALLFAATGLLGAARPPASLQLEIEGLRNSRGTIHACLTQREADFPDCEMDPAALTTSSRASGGVLRFSGLAPGTYAVTLFHDENENRKLDTVLGIPREGFGFSRNPAIRFGAPRFADADISLPAGVSHQTIKVRYLL